LRGIDKGGLQEWDTPFGTLWFPSSAAEWSVHFALAQYDLGAYPGVRIKQGDIVMDCGGYVGDWTKWAIKAGAAKVVIVEPAQEALQCLHRNLHKDIAQGRVIVYAKGVWDREGVLQFKHVEGNPAANTAVDASPTDEEKIQVTTIDRIVSELNLPRLDGIKMDIEGAEIRAIHGAAKTLNKFRPQIAIATEHTDNVSANNLGVVRAMAEVAPFYRKKCGICVRDHQIVTPQTLYFSPQ
jgi:FkbM family methyltransferase